MSYEWFYKWGREQNNKFYHAATFFKDGKKFSHWSFDGEFHEDNTHELNGDMFKPAGKRVIHNRKHGSYISIPGNPWYDHEIGDVVGSDWDWVSIILNCGIFIVGYEKKDDRLCDFTLGNHTIKSDFILENRHFYIYELGAYLTLEPLKEEIIFRPIHGRPYSETPIEVTAKGKLIGYGMRERTYKIQEV